MEAAGIPASAMRMHRVGSRPVVVAGSVVTTRFNVQCVDTRSESLQSGIYGFTLQHQHSEHTFMNAPQWFGPNEPF
jgi:hypothetical protein